MNLYPIVVRELRAQARQPMTYWVRPVALGAALVMLALLAWNDALELRQGGRALTVLHRAIFYTIWICAPLLTADCLSRERREETLGLLFLTPLRAWEVAAAKGLTQGLRCASLLLAVVPALAIPILLGGIGWPHITISAVILFVSLLLALSAGLLASSLCRSRNRALLLALLLAGGALVGMALAIGGILYLELVAFENTDAPFLGVVLMMGMFVLVDQRVDVWVDMLKATDSVNLLLNSALFLGVALLAFIAVVVFAARRMRRSLREKPKSKLCLWLEDFFFAPAYAVGFYKRWLKRGLEKNPISWLEKRRWSGRIAMWGWMAVSGVFTLGTILHLDYFESPSGWLLIKMVMYVLVAHMAVMAAGSFGRERASGVLELLLITPMSEARIIAGRLRGIWTQFLPGVLTILPAFVLVVVKRVMHHTGSLDYDFHSPMLSTETFGNLAYLLVAFCFLPVFGLYFSLRLRHVLTSVLATLSAAIILPWALTIWGIRFGLGHVVGKYGLYYRMHEDQMQSDWLVWILDNFLLRVGLPTLWLVVMGSFLLHRLHRRLVRRDFSYQVG